MKIHFFRGEFTLTDQENFRYLLNLHFSSCFSHCSQSVLPAISHSFSEICGDCISFTCTGKKQYRCKNNELRSEPPPPCKTPSRQLAYISLLFEHIKIELCQPHVALQTNIYICVFSVQDHHKCDN